MPYPQTSGVGPRPEGNRARNNTTNQRTHTNPPNTPGNPPDYVNPGGAAALPSLSPASTANYYAQLGNLYSIYQNQLAASKAERVGLRATARVQKVDIRGQLIGGLAGEENAAVGRGILGSSADLQERAGIRGAAASAQADVNAQTLQGLGASRLADQAAGLTFAQGGMTLEAQKLAEQQTALAQQLQTNAIISGAEMQTDALTKLYKSLLATSPGAGGAGGDGRAGLTNPQVARAKAKYNTIQSAYPAGLPAAVAGLPPDSIAKLAALLAKGVPVAEAERRVGLSAPTGLIQQLGIYQVAGFGGPR